MKINKSILFRINSLFNLFFPRVCLVCGKPISAKESYICASCLYHAPRIDSHSQKDNPISQIFLGRVKIEAATSLFHYSKESPYANLLYSLKYKDMKKLAIFLGSHLGRELNESPLFSDVDIIMSVPLHPKKKKKRGYNQSDLIVYGINETFPREISIDNLYRVLHTETQTRKTRIERWENVSGKFAIRDEDILKEKHILLVDDVLTTGATIEACAEILLAIEGVRLSVATLAIA
jgi:ComF family protein